MIFGDGLTRNSTPKIMKLTRQQLYLLLWSRPLEDVAKLLGLSLVTVAKRCKQFNVPRPERGYWRKVETGRPAQPATLDMPEQDTELPLEINVDPAILMQLVEQARASLEERKPNGKEKVAMAIHRASKTPIVREAPSRSADSAGALGSAGTAGLDPVLPNLLELAERHAKTRKIERFLADTQTSLQQCDLLTGAALALWIDRARCEVKELDSIGDVVRFCESLVKGEADSSWWADARTLRFPPGNSKS